MTRGLTDIEKLVLVYITNNPDQNSYEIAAYFEAGRDDQQKRQQVLDAIVYLVESFQIEHNAITGTFSA